MCSSSTVTATGSFTTNGAGGWVRYQWVRTDDRGRQTVIFEPPIYVQPGDRSLHQVVADQWTPQDPGTEQLVFLSPAGPVVPPQAWSCVG
jgi:hypothetical protein